MPLGWVAAELGIVMTVLPTWANKILSGEKTVETRSQKKETFKGTKIKGSTVGICKSKTWSRRGLHQVFGEAKVADAMRLSYAEYRSAYWCRRHCIPENNLHNLKFKKHH